MSATFSQSFPMLPGDPGGDLRLSLLEGALLVADSGCVKGNDMCRQNPKSQIPPLLFQIKMRSAVITLYCWFSYFFPVVWLLLLHRWPPSKSNKGASARVSLEYPIASWVTGEQNVLNRLFGLTALQKIETVWMETESDQIIEGTRFVLHRTTKCDIPC